MNYSREERAKLLEGWRRSGKSISAYVREKGLVRWTFTKWLKAERDGRTGFCGSNSGGRETKNASAADTH
jgi:transposase-like protein